MSGKIKVVIYQEDDQWVAQALNVEVSSFGATSEAARDSIREALELYFEDMPASDVNLPGSVVSGILAASRRATTLGSPHRTIPPEGCPPHDDDLHLLPPHR